jgi:ABC-2 type transport system permease protein
LLAITPWLGTSVGIRTTSVQEEVAPAWELPFSLPGLGSQIPIPFAEKELRRTPMAELVDANVFLPATANLFSLGLMMAGFSTLMSSWDRYRWRTIGIVVGLYVLEVMAKIAGLASDQLRWLTYFSVLTAYEPEACVRVADVTPEFAWSLFLYDQQGQWVGYGPLSYDGLMAGVGIVCYVIAGVVFCRRDLPPPL